MEEKEISIEELQKQVEDCRLRSEEYLAGWKRERADFINYKKDEMEKMGELIKYANEELILKILPILDNFYLAEKHIPEDNEFTEGFLQIKKQLQDFLAKEGIEEIKTIGEKFNPNTMEVVEEVDGDPFSAKDNGERVSANTGTVAEEIQKGYKMDDKIIRPAKVKIVK
ncbi:MAG: nucleotide exchange factor GrpE [Candidatus Staskawiczbacteria bacterium]|nr:nucleotide exchange factor GrpE [Candidatus Staskawiczbacteria bacterium]